MYLSETGTLQVNFHLDYDDNSYNHAKGYQETPTGCLENKTVENRLA